MSGDDERFDRLRKMMAKPPRRLTKLFGPCEDIPVDIIHLGTRYSLEKAWTCKAPAYIGKGFMEAVFLKEE